MVDYHWIIGRRDIRPIFLSTTQHGGFHMNITKFKPAYLLMLILAYAGAITGCNTIEGAGEDIQRGGKAIEDEAQEHK
jgi:predicted small secreted protein